MSGNAHARVREVGPPFYYGLTQDLYRFYRVVIPYFNPFICSRLKLFQTDRICERKEGDLLLLNTCTNLHQTTTWLNRLIYTYMCLLLNLYL
jgi:hypothetical protein